MNPQFQQPNDPKQIETVLLQVGIWLPLLGSGENAEFFFYILDLNRTVKYVSESVWSVSNLRSEELINRPLQPLLTDNPCNQSLAIPDAELEPSKVYRIQLEIWDYQKNRVKLESWRRAIFWNEALMGSVGMARRSDDRFSKDHSTETQDPAEIKRRFATLTPREIEVVELVVDGELNKSIAKQLNIAMRTVEARRSKAMSKLGIRRLPDLVRFWILAKELMHSETRDG